MAAIDESGGLAHDFRAETDEEGAFHRGESAFRQWVSDDGSTPFAVEAGRYHLYAARSCPWAHRAIIARRLMGLEDAISISLADPIRDGRGWRFSGGAFVDQVNGFAFLSEAYLATDPSYDYRPTTPALWDRQTRQIVSNESADVMRMFETVFAPLASHPVDLCPEPLREEIDALGQRIYDELNDAVYRAGFTEAQQVYEREVNHIFALLDELDERLSGRRYLLATPEPVETDWRLFTTLVRFDAVYAIHFKCSRRKIAEYEHLWPYLRDLYQRPGIAETVDFEDIRAHYYVTQPTINPNGLIAVQPAGDFAAPHGRERLS